MKKLLISLTLISAMILSSCNSAGDTEQYDVTIKKGNTEYKVKKVFVSDGEYIFVVYPVDSSISVLPSQSTMRVSHGKYSQNHTVVVLQ